MQPDSMIQAQIDDLLRTDQRLVAASPLIGQVFALITEPKPPSAKKRPRKAPPRIDAGLGLRVEGDTTTVTFRAGDGTALRDAAAALREHAEGAGEEDEEAPSASGPAPWLKFCRAKKVPNEYRALFGDKALAVVVVDGWLWARADAEAKRAGLTLALRGLEHHVRASDKADMCKRTAPPLQTWPDCVDELSHLVAAFTDDPATAAEHSAAVERCGVTTALAAAQGRDKALIRDLRDAWENKRGRAADADEVAEYLTMDRRIAAALGEDPSVEHDRGMALLLRELNAHEQRLREAQATFEETDCCDTMHMIEVLEGQVGLLRELLTELGGSEGVAQSGQRSLRDILADVLDAAWGARAIDEDLRDEAISALGYEPEGGEAGELTGDEGYPAFVHDEDGGPEENEGQA